MSVSINSEDTLMTENPIMEPTSNIATNLPATAAVAATTAATATATTTATTTTATTPPTTTTTSKKPQTLPPTVRIYVDTTELTYPVIVNYRQLYKRELKKTQEGDLPTVVFPKPSAINNSLETENDLFYRELLKKAEAYNVDDDDVNDDGSDEENAGNESKKRNDYDFEDPFIDDSDMLMDQPIEYSAPEYHGFFVHHGPLDASEGTNTEKKTSTPTAASASTTKRKASSKAKASSSIASTSGNKKDSGSGAAASTEKSRKKAVITIDDNGDDKKKSNASTSTGSSNNSSTTTVTKAKKSSNTPISNATATGTKKASAPPDKVSKKRAKLDHNPSKEDEAAHKSIASSPALSTIGSVDEAATHSSSIATTAADKSKKKSTGVPPALKPLDPEIELLMQKLKHDVKAEDFNNKAKFPAALKPTVLEAGLITFRKNRIIDDNLVYHLMNILPYNKFTLKKFLTTKSGQMRVDELQQEIDELAILLKQTIDRMMPEQQRLFDEKLAQAQASTEPSNPEEEDSTPIPKFKCNDEVRKILYDIIQSEEQSIHIANQVALHKDSEKKAEGLASDGKARKLMYQRLLSCWPEGWMHSYEMSRQYSQYKSKVSSMSEKKNTNSSLPTTPKANIATVESKKRKRTTPTITGTEVLRKKQSVVADIAHTPTSGISTTAVEPQQSNVMPANVITIDDDTDDVQPSWKQSNSMKIEALISGPSTEKKN